MSSELRRRGAEQQQSEAQQAEAVTAESAFPLPSSAAPATATRIPSLRSRCGYWLLGLGARAVAACFPSVQYVALPSDAPLPSASASPRLLALFGQAYDVSAFASVHPGGSVILSQLEGSDCSDAFAVHHPRQLVQQARDIAQQRQPRGLLKALHRGAWSTAAAAASASSSPSALPSPSASPYYRSALQRDFDAIVAALEAEGKFDPTVGFYLCKAAVQLLLLCIAVALVAVANSLTASSGGTETLPQPLSLSLSISINQSAPLSSAAAACWQPPCPPLSLPLPSSALPVLWLLPCSPFVLYSVSALLLGVFWQQMAFLGHDAGHNQITGSARSDYRFAWLVTALFGVSGSWWKRNHNVHHVHTNSIECDPDIQHLPMLAVSEEILKGFWSAYHQKRFVMDRVAQCLVRYQHLLYYPLMSIARANLYVQSFLLCLNPNVRVPHRRCELLALAVFWCWFGALILCLPSPLLRCWYYAVSHAVAGLIHVQITLSHFAMPAYHGPQLPSVLPVCSTTHDEHGVHSLERDSRSVRNRLHNAADLFVLTQFSTTMNVSCSRVWDWFHGGLQFQVEHHLLPRLPRQHLRYAMEKYIRPFAHRHRLPYHSYSFLRGQQLVYAQLRQQALAMDSVCQPTAAAVAVDGSFLWQGIMARG